MPFVNVYLIDLAYGGSEEGDWWYESGTAQKTIPTSTMKDAERALRLAKRICERLNGERRSDLGSVLSEGRFEARIDRQPARNYPLRKPGYS